MKSLLRIVFVVLVLATITNFVVSANAKNKVSKSKTEKKEKMEEKNNPQYVITVKQGDVKFGDIVLELFPDVAPKHCHNFDSLVNIKFYDGTAFHRVIPGFMIQGGDPNSKNKPKETWGMGEPGQKTVPAEFNDISHERGILSAARTSDPNSATSQFFICVAAASHLNKQYTVYGKVISGMDVVDKIVSVPCDGSSPKVKVEMQIKKMSNK
jgi:peptidyl-prolyl cis-trans isomerase B (cyclophilin B)